jgi:hypothetical protein
LTCTSWKLPIKSYTLIKINKNIFLCTAAVVDG